MDDDLSSPESPVRDPFDLTDSNYPTDTSLSTSQDDDPGTSTYGQLVNEIYKCGSRILRYHDDYLKTRSSAPPEETAQYEFVSKGDYLCAGRDFTVFAGFLFRDYNASPSFPQKKRDSHDYGDHKFVKPWSGTSASAVSFMSMDRGPTRVAVALKESVQSIHQSGNRRYVLGTFLQEVRIMGEMKSCPNIVDLLGVAFVEVGQEVKPTLVVKLALGNLIDFFRSNIPLASTWEWRLRFASEIGAALQALHAKGTIHADVKGQNVLVFPHEGTQFCAKLSDFGNSTTTAVKSPIATGTKYWLAPECLAPISEGDEDDHEQYGNSEYRDIYAFGLLAWEIATSCQQPPFSDISSDDEIVHMKYSEDGETAKYLLGRVPEDTPQSFREIISETLHVDPTRRISLDAVADKLQEEIGRISFSMTSTSDSVRTSPPQSPLDESSKTTDTAPPLIRAPPPQSPLDESSITTIEHPPLIRAPPPPPPSDELGKAASEESLLKIPWSLQRRLHEESMQSSDRDVDSKVFLAYCYILCSDRHQELREEALRLLRQLARLDPFHLAPGSALTPFRAMMELQDWEGLSEILTRSTRPEVAERCLQHIYSFGWQRFIVLACTAGTAALRDIDTLKFSENVVVASVDLLSSSGNRNIGQAAWGEDGITAIHMASVSGKPHAVSALLANGGNPSARDKDSRTPLHLCCQAASLSDNLSVEIARSICERHPSTVNDVMERTLYTPLRFAVEAEKLRLCQFLLENGADVNATAAEGSTALQECAWVAGEKGNGRRDEGCKDEKKALELAEILLKYGKVDINLRSCHNSVTALGIAAIHGNFLDMVSLLLDYGADLNTSVDDLTVLAAAVQHNNQEMLRILLERGADPNCSVRSITPLGLAVGLDRHDAAPFLLEHGADPSVPHQGMPLVCWAIYACRQTGQDGVCPNLALLLQRGASVSAATKSAERPSGAPPGWSAVHFAAVKLSPAALGMVLDHNASLSARTEDQETALHIAVSYTSGLDSARMLAMLEELIQHGIDLDAIDVLGETALHKASKYHLDDIRGYLLKAGCDPNIKDPLGRTAEQLCGVDLETVGREERTRRKAIKEQREQPANTLTPSPPSSTEDHKPSSDEITDGRKKNEDQKKQDSVAKPNDAEESVNGERKHSAAGRSARSFPLLTCLACTLLALGIAAYTRTSRSR